jgi:uncharacterized protein
MPTIRHNAALRALVAVRGHPFDRTAFDAIFQAMDGISATMVDQPAAALLMNPEGMRDFDVLVLYDMPGLDFDAPVPPRMIDPPEALRRGFAALLDAGKGVVALHHAIAGWPTWEDYHLWLGGQFLYRPATLRGMPCPDSGYRHDVTGHVRTLPHPVTLGVSDSFTLTDERYLAQVFTDLVEPLLIGDGPVTADAFWSAARAMDGHMFDNSGWQHPDGSPLLGWTRTARNSRIVTLLPGDGPSAYDNPDYRRLIANAIRWVAGA